MRVRCKVLSAVLHAQKMEVGDLEEDLVPRRIEVEEEGQTVFLSGLRFFSVLLERM